MSAPTVLLTGFEPFGGDDVNPSWEAARRLDGRTIAGARVTARCLPCIFGESLGALRREVRALRPAAVICCGVAGSRAAITPERVAVNLDDARIPDNAGRQPLDQPVIPRGPAAYFSTLPVKAITAALAAAGFPAEVSHTAGSFVCNHVFYGLMHALARSRRQPQARGGFIHVPFARGANGLLGHDRLAEALAIAVRETLRRRSDRRLRGGLTD